MGERELLNSAKKYSMGRSRDIRELIRQIAGTSGTGVQAVFFSGVVESSDGEQCRVKVGDVVMEGVRCTAVIDGDAGNLKVKPAAGSVVLLADLSAGTMRDMAVVAWSKIDEIIFDGGQNGGMCRVPELKTQLDKLTARVDGIINAIKSATPAVGAADGGASLKTSIVTGLSTISQKENFSSIENKKIKH